MSVIISGTDGITFPNSTTQVSAGQVLQVVNVVSTAQLNTSSLSYVATALTATITPKFSTSKILVTVAGNIYGNLYATIYRNGTTDLSSTIYGFIGSNVTNVSTASATALDSPTTTSATTYTLYLKGGTTGASPWWNIYNSSTTITLMEIAG